MQRFAAIRSRSNENHSFFGETHNGQEQWKCWNQLFTNLCVPKYQWNLFRGV